MDCTSCGRANRPSARFCDACGAALAAPSGDTGIARKVVTIVFADLIGSTSLHERLDAESVRRVMDRYYRALREVVDAHGGRVVKLLGDGVMAAFGVPRVREDDAVRAVRAAVGMQDAVRTLVREQRGVLDGVGLRVAVNTGEVVVSEDNTDVVGDPVNVAARLQQEGSDGDVLIGEATRRLVGELVTLVPFGSRALRGRAESVAAYRVASLERPAGASAVPFVGRDEELRRLLAVFHAAAVHRAARLAVVLGSPGLGKSRLIAEVVRRIGDGATVIAARCDAAGGPTFTPLADALRRLLDLEATADVAAVRAAVVAVLPRDDAEGTRIVDGIIALIAGTPPAPEEAFFVVRRFLAKIAAARPVLLVIDDLQWGETLLFDLVEHLVQWTSDAALLVLVAGRPELRDVHASLCAPGGLAREVVTLGGLDAAAATRLAASAIGADALPAALAGRVLATSEGNPLFVGELVRMLVQDGVLKREGDRWTAGVEVARLEMPPTIHALLAARIERLRPEEQAVLERAAVVGRQFSRAAVAELLPPGDDVDLDGRLESLRRSELVEPDDGWFLGEPALRFHHVLIRDAAYRRLLKGTRAELHGRLADWIEGRAGDGFEHDETIGWHLEQAHQHLGELGPLDERARTIGTRAARHLAAAGRRALARDDLPVAASLLGRALARLDAEDPTRPDLVLDWCEALLAAGDVAAGASAVETLDRLAEGSVRLRAWHTCFAGQLAALTNPQALHVTADAVAAAATALAAAGDAMGEAKAHSVHAVALVRLGKIGASEATLDRALAATRRAGDRRRANTVLAGAPVAALWGPSPVTRASGRCLDVVRVLRITQGAPAVEAVALRCQAVLEALRGRTDAARRMIRASRRMVEELGIAPRVLEADVFAGIIELIEEDYAAAEAITRGAYERFTEQGLGVDAAQAGVLLGRALLGLGRPAEAEALSHACEALAGDDLKAGIGWRGVRAEALAQRGEHGAAFALARAAVDMAAATDALLDHALARLALAVVLRAARRPGEADAEETRAIELWEAKGATRLVEQARHEASRAVPAAGDGATTDARLAPAVFTNAASRWSDELHRYLHARDWEAVEAQLGTLRLVDRRRVVGVDLAARELLDSFRVITEMGFREDAQLLATRGERLALLRVRVAMARAGGQASVDFCSIVEVDDAGRPTLIESFDAGDLRLPHDRLDERYAAGEGAPFAALLANVRAFGRASEARDWDTVARLLPDDFTLTSHRRVVGSQTIGRDEYLATRGAIDDLGLRGDLRLDHVLRLSATRSVQVVTWYGTIGGGPFEDTFVAVYAHDGSRFHTIDLHDLEQLDAVLLRHDAASGKAPPPRLRTVAMRAQEEAERRWRERDRDGAMAGFAPDCVMDDRRSLVGVRVAGADFLTNLRFLFAAPSSSFESEVLATRGERLVLLLERFSGEMQSGGVFADEHLAVVERDAGERVVSLTNFDPDAIEAGYAALDARFGAGEAATHAAVWSGMNAFSTAFAARDWDVLGTRLAPDLEVHDHRLMGWETLRGPAAYVQGLRSLVELAPDVRLRLDHAALCERGYFVISTWVGSREGGPFETPSYIVAELDPAGRVRRFDQYDMDGCAAAEERYASVAAVRGPTLAIPDAVAARLPRSAATAAMNRVQAAFERRDWDALRACAVPEAIVEHLQTVVRAAPGARMERRLATVMGERIAVEHVVWQNLPSGGSLAAEAFWLTEVDARERITAMVPFEVVRRREAFREAGLRVLAIDPAAVGALPFYEFSEAFNDHDLTRIRAVLADDFVLLDHRLTGMGEVDRDGYLRATKAFWDLAPDVLVDGEPFTLATADHGAVTFGRLSGTLPDGGTFENYLINVGMSAGGRIKRIEFFELEAVDDAIARLDELRPDPLRIPPNAASRARDLWQDALEAQDWRAMEALCAPAMLFDDRRSANLLVGGREGFVESARFLRSIGAAVSRTLLATMGDRLALEHCYWRRENDQGALERETLVLSEVDGEARLVTAILFDPDGRRTASAELTDRYARGEGAAWSPRRAHEFLRAVWARDLAACRAALPDDFVFCDHRRTGPGRVEGADAYVGWLGSLWERAPDATFETLYVVAAAEHAMLGIARVFGTMKEGGEFESFVARVFRFRGDELVGLVLFEAEDLERARVHFEALRPDPLRKGDA